MDIVQPKISIITVCYNSVKTIERTIQSVLMQQYENLEYIIIDGGSTDGTVDIIKKYESKISKWISEPDKGISDAFNKGITLATGELIGIINSDDGYLENAFNYVIASYEKGTDIYRGNIIFWNTDTDSKIIEKPTLNMPYSGWKINVCHQAVFISRKAYEKYGYFNENYKYNMDFDLILRFEKNGANSKHIDHELAYFTMEGVTFSKFKKDMRLEMETIIISNGGKMIDIIKYRFTKSIKMILKKILSIDRVLKLKNYKG